jgi:hypothetical protein
LEGARDRDPAGEERPVAEDVEPPREVDRKDDGRIVVLWSPPPGGSALESSSAVHADASQVLDIEEGILLQALRTKPVVIHFRITAIYRAPRSRLPVEEVPAHDHCRGVSVITTLDERHVVPP